jgi:hypothetical protein
MFWRVLGTIGVIVLLGATPLLAQEAMTAGELAVEKMTFCAGVEDREPIGEATEFTTEVSRVWCWTEIVGAADTTFVTHKWYWDGENVANVELEVKYPRMRTWSYKTLTPEMAGSWKVEVVDASGEVLKELSFQIK